MAFADGNKYGRMSDDELDDVFGHFKNVIDKDPERAIAMLIVPTLTSARRQKGDRDERARIERKADAKFLTAWLCQLYMSMAETHGNDTKQRSYNVYILWTDDEEEAAKNPFLNSYMVHRRGTMQDAQWIDPSAVYVPMSQPGSAVTVMELGQEKRAAQLLGGHDVARCLVQATLTNKNNKPLLKPADVCIWSHWTPLDACIELVVRQEAMKPDMPNMHTFSASNVASDALACQARLMSTFLKDWKWNKQEYIIGEALQYSEELPEAKKKEIGNIDAEPPKLRLCSWITENGQECLSLPDGVRNKWIEHPMYGEQWRLAITAFLKATKTLLTPMSRPAQVAPPAGGEDDTSEGGEWATMSEEAIRAQNEIQKEFPTDFRTLCTSCRATRNCSQWHVMPMERSRRTSMCSTTVSVIGRSLPMRRSCSPKIQRTSARRSASKWMMTSASSRSCRRAGEQQKTPNRLRGETFYVISSPTAWAKRRYSVTSILDRRAP